TTLAPRSESACARPAPIPALAPVTTTTVSFHWMPMRQTLAPRLEQLKERFESRVAWPEGACYRPDAMSDVDALLTAVREAARPGTWTQGLNLSRGGAVAMSARTAESVELRVR